MKKIIAIMFGVFVFIFFGCQIATNSGDIILENGTVITYRRKSLF
jgi:acetyltransferase-like isoleucine patch superfamily enzyme